MMNCVSMPPMTVCQGILRQSREVTVRTAIMTTRPNRETARLARVLSPVSSGTMVPTRNTATVTSAARGLWSLAGIISYTRYAVLCQTHLTGSMTTDTGTQRVTMRMKTQR